MKIGMRRVSVFVFAILIAVGCSPTEPYVDPLPAENDVQAIEVVRYLYDRVTFTIPLDEWKKIRAALLPARLDKRPSTWSVVGTMQITKRNGAPFCIHLYRTDSGPGAFSAGPTFEERIYYRGGKTVDLIKILDQAYEAEQPKETSPPKVQ